MVNVNIEIPGELHKKIMLEKAETGNYIHNIIVRAIEEYFERSEK